jgi:hypothetical protein
VTTPGTYPTGDPGPRSGYSEEAAAQLRKASGLSDAIATPGMYADRDRERLREARDDAFRAADGWISLAAIAEHMVMAGDGVLTAGLRPQLQAAGEDDGPEVGVAFQRLRPGAVIEEGPGS